MLPDRRAHATLPVSDLEAARIFYEQSLGFRPIRENPAAILYGAGDGTAFAIARSGGQ
ncbi:MAG TPA: VOC family protein [Candidatus Limnocylindrales bacterium]